MLLNQFDPSSDVIDKVVLGEGDWPKKSHLTATEVVVNNLPFKGVRKAVKQIEVDSVLYSIDGNSWHQEFPLLETLEAWREGTLEELKSEDKEVETVINGVIRVPVEIDPDKTMVVREIAFYSGKKLCVYKTVKDFIVGGIDGEQRTYRFNYHIHCHFATVANINSIARRA